ncbi:organic solute transporter alpha protein 3 isoform X1 [Biomphalaria glabrata]|nr:organic solute transporter alpha protein 3 isoform X1 [Biomphalaria glabrata]
MLTSIAVVAMLVPKMFVFRDVAMSVCLSVVMYKFLEMLVALGNQFDSIRHEIIYHRRLHFNVRPLCCLFSCLPTAQLTRTNFLVMKMLILQHPILIVLITVITMVTWLDGTYVIGKWDINNPFPYLSALRVTSVLVAIYALSSIVTLCKDAMKDLYVSQKYMALSVALFLFSVQGLTFDILTSLRIFEFRQCLSGRTMRNFYENSMYCVQMFLVTLYNVFYYRRPLNPQVTSDAQNQNKPPELQNHQLSNSSGPDITGRPLVIAKDATTQTLALSGDCSSQTLSISTLTRDDAVNGKQNSKNNVSYNNGILEHF